MTTCRATKTHRTEDGGRSKLRSTLSANFPIWAVKEWTGSSHGQLFCTESLTAESPQGLVSLNLFCSGDIRKFCSTSVALALWNGCSVCITMFLTVPVSHLSALFLNAFCWLRLMETCIIFVVQNEKDPNPVMVKW